MVHVGGVGLVCALGTDPAEVDAALRRGESGLVAHERLSKLPGPTVAGLVPKLDLRTWLVRRKDRKLMARASQVALPPFGVALGDWPGDRSELGLFVGVGREPPDDGDSEAALVAAARDGQLDPALLAGPGRDRYPPLLPLQTLPNMALAHVSINLGIGGENGAWAGGPAAGLRALVAGIRAVEEGRCPAALAGGADSLVDRGSQRDRMRLGLWSPPGEAGAALLLLAGAGDVQVEVLPAAEAAGASSTEIAHHAGLGDCGAADGAVAVARAVARVKAGAGPQTVAFADRGQPAIGVRVSAS